MKWQEETKGIFKETLEIFRHLHRNPELSGREYNTTAYIARQLQSMGMETLTFDGVPGVVGQIKRTGACFTVAVRSDMDGLPVQEGSACEFPSTVPGVMHACGHDLHMAVCLGVARVISGYKDMLPFNIKFIFQPAEETNQGARMLMERRVLKDPDVDLLVGYHAMPELASGMIGVGSGPVMSAESNFSVEISGKSSHGSQPQKGRDALLAAAHAVLALQGIISRGIDPLDSAVLSICRFNAGEANNVIADKALFSGTVRYFRPEVETAVREQMQAMVENTARAYGCSSRTEFISEQPPLVNSPEIAGTAMAALKEEFGGEKVTGTGPCMASEDFSYYLEKVKGVFLWLGSSFHGEYHPLHSPSFRVDPASIATGIAAVGKIVEMASGWKPGKP